MAAKNQLLQQGNEMKKTSYISLTMLLCVSALCSCGRNAINPAEGETTKKERNFIKSGNRAYNDSDFVKAAEQFYRALNINPSNQKTIYNIATAQLSGGKKTKTADNSAVANGAADSLTVKSDSIYHDLLRNCPDSLIKEFSAYNAGNIAYAKDDYASSIEMYKEALRLNPDNDMARENLRLAQLKQQNNSKEGDGEGENKQDKQDQNQNQNQNQDQNKQNQDKNKQDPNSGQQQQQQDKSQQQQQQQQQQPQPQKGEISKENAEKILKAMENAENDTRRRQQDKEKKQAIRKILDKPW